MSKGLGQKIGIMFTEDLVGDVTGMNPIIRYAYVLPAGIVTANNRYSTSYEPDKAFRDDLSFWYTRTIPAWIQIELAEAILAAGFKWDTGTTSYRPKDFIVRASNDGVNWDELYSNISPNISDWKEFTWESTIPYKFYRWSISTRWSSYLYIYQIEILAAMGNRDAFSVSGQEYQYINGPLIDKEYPVVSVERYSAEADSPQNKILLSFGDLSTERFSSVEGNLIVKYDITKGNLTGQGGAVDSFTETFLPMDLEPKPNPGITENVHVSMDAELAFTKIYYRGRYIFEKIVAVPGSVDIIFTYVGVVNP